jgi:hypothetical protein
MPDENIALRWSAYEHDHVERGPDWHWALGVITVCIAVTSILFHNVLFAVLVVLAAISIALLARTPPRECDFEISDSGIRINGALHRYDEILAFWVEDEHYDRPLLLVDTTRFLSPNLIIPIEHIESGLVRAFLKERVEERHMREPLPHRLFDFLGL